MHLTFFFDLLKIGSLIHLSNNCVLTCTEFCPGILRGGQKKNAALTQQKFTLWPCPGRTDFALNRKLRGGKKS